MPRTLDEAIKIAGKDLPVFDANLMDSKQDVNNPHLRKIIVEMAIDLMAKIAEAEEGKITPLVCSRLHVMFALGKNIGIIMEREELK